MRQISLLMLLKFDQAWPPSGLVANLGQAPDRVESNLLIFALQSFHKDWNRFRVG
jgi:hypothetical protein